MMSSARISNLLGVLAGFVVVAAILISTRLVVDSIGTERLREAIEEAGPWAPGLYMALKIASYVIAPLRFPLLELWSGVLFGTWMAVVYSVAAELIGGSANFWIARLLGQPVVRRLMARWGMNQSDDIFNQVGGWRALLFARLFLPGYDFLSYAAGLTGLRFPAYALITAVGGIPRTYLNVALGATLVEDTRLFFTYSAALVVFYAVAIFLQQWWHRRAVRRMR